MGRCAACGRFILGGAKVGARRFCNTRCKNAGRILAVAPLVPDEAVAAFAAQIHRGPCPECKGPGPVDVYFSYRIWSVPLLTRSTRLSQISCRRCGLKSQVDNLIFSVMCGWWDFSVGFIFTPLQIGRNIVAMTSPPDAAAPSGALLRRARLQLAARLQQ